MWFTSGQIRKSDENTFLLTGALNKHGISDVLHVTMRLR